jgi:hypothetical protein
MHQGWLATALALPDIWKHCYPVALFQQCSKAYLIAGLAHTGLCHSSLQMTMPVPYGSLQEVLPAPWLEWQFQCGFAPLPV